MPAKLWKSEAELAARVVEYLRDLKWVVYQEVQVERFGAVADIVATRGPELMIVETKLSVTLALLEQAIAWTGTANWVVAATPHVKLKAPRAVRSALRHNGVGLWHVQYAGEIVESIRPELVRRCDGDVRKVLRPEHLTFAKAGTNTGRHFTPFQATAALIVQAVRKQPGIGLKELVEGIKHHYASNTSARCALAKWIGKGVIEGVEVRQVASKWGVYPK